MPHPAFRDLEPTDNPQVNAYFDALGVSDDFLDYTTEAIAKGLPEWPSGTQRYRVVRTDNSLILATEGLAGYGIELYLEIMYGHGWLPEQITLNWQFNLLRQAATTVAQHAGLPVADLPLALAVAAVPGAPAQLYLTADHSAGLAMLAGMDVPGRAAAVNDGSVHLVPLTAITPAEFAHIQDAGAKGAHRVARLRAAARFHHVTIDSPDVTAEIDQRLAHETGQPR